MPTIKRTITAPKPLLTAPAPEPVDESPAAVHRRQRDALAPLYQRVYAERTRIKETLDPESDYNEDKDEDKPCEDVAIDLSRNLPRDFWLHLLWQVSATRQGDRPLDLLPLFETASGTILRWGGDDFDEAVDICAGEGCDTLVRTVECKNFFSGALWDRCASYWLLHQLGITHSDIGVAVYGKAPEPMKEEPGTTQSVLPGSWDVACGLDDVYGEIAEVLDALNGELRDQECDFTTSIQLGERFPRNLWFALIRYGLLTELSVDEQDLAALVATGTCLNLRAEPNDEDGWRDEYDSEGAVRVFLDDTEIGIEKIDEFDAETWPDADPWDYAALCWLLQELAITPTQIKTAIHAGLPKRWK
jgi:hypothetical protein